jgi:phosphate transport system permease protein
MAAALPVKPGVRERVLAQSGRIRRVKLLDRLAVGVISLGGVFVIVAVSFIFVFILGEAAPLFRTSSGQVLGDVRLGALPPLEVSSGAPGATEPFVLAHAGTPLLLGSDEYQKHFYEVLSDGRLAFFDAASGAFVQQSYPAALGPAQVTAASRSLMGDFVALATADGRVALRQVRFRPRYEEQRLVGLDVDVRERGLVQLDSRRQPLREVAYDETDGRQIVAALAGEREVVVWRTDDEGGEHRARLEARPGETLTRVRLGRSDTLVAASAGGNLYHWELSPEVRLTEVRHVSERAITALEYVLGGVTLIVGDEDGALHGWFRVRLRDDDPDPQFVKAHTYPAQGSAVRAISASTRGKSFVTAGADGSLVLRHMTSERTEVAFPATGKAVDTVLLTPKMDAILAKQADGGIARYAISSPHPEITWKALFGKVWYEGYARPEYTWQSTGGTDDFETKFSLVPLIFGTIKGTFYALLFAIPLAVAGALYTSQFMHPSLKAKVKPTVEIMAALPSVVIGFVAGLWLASRMERQIVPVLLMVVLLPAFGTAGVLIWERLPRSLRLRLKPGTELGLILPLVALGGAVALALGPLVEARLFGGDFRLWISSTLGLVYDQRNCLVVGLAMGFAVIPIIFTIAEDSFSSVPQHLTAASLALGASRWQTALRVVLPTASPGVFSAIMIGFGRAVGETMIVLMATGNTPVLEWSIFNGMRTLSANIAVEVPEAPYGGTLYRTLFLAALILFVMTFVVNTVAELVRQRLRERYRAV